MPSTEANTVDDTHLGLTDEEIALLRYHQAQAAGSSSSRAASRASSQGRLLLDSSSLAALSRHLDRLLRQIHERIEYLSEQSSIVTLQQFDHAGHLVDNADAEIARYQELMAQIDELEVDFDRIEHIRDIVRDYRQRVEQLEPIVMGTAIVMAMDTHQALQDADTGTNDILYVEVKLQEFIVSER
ncbi:hypothetical protein GGR57DRAFT_498522 [Xylariaceae sp. FL1272]|nr:hypothetical protein GGR57DRAFT_498522 [Xylariaceae sp. FL1272]